MAIDRAVSFDRSVFSKIATPSVPLDLGEGVELQLCYDMNAAALVRQKLGKSIFSRADMTSLDLSEWPVIVWAGVQRHHKGITIEDLGGVMNLGNTQHIIEVCTAAMTITVKKDDADGDPTTEPETEPVPVQ